MDANKHDSDNTHLSENSYNDIGYLLKYITGNISKEEEWKIKNRLISDAKLTILVKDLDRQIKQGYSAEEIIEMYNQSYEYTFNRLKKDFFESNSILTQKKENNNPITNEAQPKSDNAIISTKNSNLPSSLGKIAKVSFFILLLFSLRGILFFWNNNPIQIEDLASFPIVVDGLESLQRLDSKTNINVPPTNKKETKQVRKYSKPKEKSTSKSNPAPKFVAKFKPLGKITPKKKETPLQSLPSSKKKSEDSAAFAKRQKAIFVIKGKKGNGKTWAKPLGNLQKALKKARKGDTIYVSANTFHPVNCIQCNLKDREKSFKIPNGVVLLGGYVLNDSTNKYQRSLNTKTVLSGNIGISDYSDNSFSVVTTIDITNKTIVDGFVIQEGNANKLNPDSPAHGFGAGWFNTHSKPSKEGLIIRNCVFKNNYARDGGAMMNFVTKALPVKIKIEYCHFNDNRAYKSGGGIYNFIDDNRNNDFVLAISSSKFITNFANKEGGAIYANLKDSDYLVLDDYTKNNAASSKDSAKKYIIPELTAP